MRILAGNHEEMFLRSFDELEMFRHFLRHGGRETVLSYGVDHEAFTHSELTEAQAMYRACGYREIPRYDDNVYAGHWFEKRLASGEGDIWVEAGSQNDANPCFLIDLLYYSPDKGGRASNKFGFTPIIEVAVLFAGFALGGPPGFALTGDAANADPVCSLSPMRRTIDEALEEPIRSQSAKTPMVTVTRISSPTSSTAIWPGGGRSRPRSGPSSTRPPTSCSSPVR